MIAQNIEGCNDCPLYQYDCVGGFTSDGCGEPIEPPCLWWNLDDEIYKGMYRDRC